MNNKLLQDMMRVADAHAFRTVGHDRHEDRHQVYSEKLAELIVQECLTQIDSVNSLDYQRDNWDKGYNKGLQQAEEAIKEHFGIK